ncbi:hypothetical protein [Nocardia brasiliensis]|uniref:hypothetical protein n=1 Tax=Nocardia brasiliensis TaxID=37326 RepID=UPI0033C769D3
MYGQFEVEQRGHLQRGERGAGVSPQRSPDAAGTPAPPTKGNCVHVVGGGHQCSKAGHGFFVAADKQSLF